MDGQARHFALSGLKYIFMTLNDSVTVLLIIKG